MAVPPNSEESESQPDESDTQDSSKPDSSRRDFLRGRSAMEAIRGQAENAGDFLADAIPRDQLRRQDHQSSYLEQYSKNAMACEFELLFNLHQYQNSGAAAMEAFQLIDLLEDQMTVYRDHSEVSRLNRTAFEQDVVIEQRLFELIQLAQQIHHETDQAFDITSTPLTRVWGFDQRDGGVPLQNQIDEVLGLVGSKFIDLNVETNTIRFKRQGVGINLGGIGKGHALDRVGELFEYRSVADFVIHGGQSSVLARGSSVCEPEPTESSTAQHEPGNTDVEQSHGWVVGISHPTLPGVRLAEVCLRNRALGTSGSGRQGFFHQGKRYGHIIDPRTGWPANHFLSTTVMAESAAVSDALATAFFVMPLEAVKEYCDTHPDVAAILITNDSTQKSQVRLDVLNLADRDWHRLV